MTTASKISSEYTLRFPPLAAILPLAGLLGHGSNSTKTVSIIGGNFAHINLPSADALDGMNERDVNRGVLASAIMIASQMQSKQYLGRIQELLATTDLPDIEIEGFAKTLTPDIAVLTLLAVSLTNVFAKTLGSTSTTFTSLYYDTTSSFTETLDAFYLYCNAQTEEGISDSILNAVSFLESRKDTYESTVRVICEGIDFTNAKTYSEYASGGGRSDVGTGRGSFKGFNSVYLGFQIAELANKLIRTNRELLELFKGLVRGHEFSLQDSIVDYDSTLRGRFEGLFKSDHSYARPNKRYMFTGVIMPSMISHNVKLVFAVDHSGSISAADSAHQLGVIDAVLSKHPNHTTSLMAFDTQLHGEVKLEAGERLIDGVARLGETVGEKGGTSFQAVFDAISQREDLAEIDMITIISADGLGGNINLSEEFESKFKGKILFVFHNDSTGTSSANGYVNSFNGNHGFEAMLYTRNA